jgi:hypothetical protein
MIGKVLSFSLLIFALLLCGEGWASDLRADATRIVVDVEKSAGKLSPLWKPGAYVAGLGASSRYNPDFGSILRRDEFRGELGHPDAFRKWKEDVGFEGGLFRIPFDLLTYYRDSFPSEKDRVILDVYEGIIRDILEGGGVPLLTFTSMPYTISSNPTKEGRPTYPPRHYGSWRRYVSDVVRYFSVEKKLEGIWYHIWHEPNTSLWENRYQRRLYRNRFPGDHVTKFWKGTRDQFFSLYREAVKAVEEVERDHGVKIPVGGVNIQALGRWDMGDPKSFPESFVHFCRENDLRLDFFSYRIVTEDLGRWSHHFRELLDRNAYGDTKLVVVDWMLGGEIKSKNNIGGNRRGVERDCEIQAAAIPAFIADMERSGIDRQSMETMQDWDVRKYLDGYPLFRSQIGTSFTVGNIIKPAFNVCRMLTFLGEERVVAKVDGDSNIGVVATRAGEEIALLIWYFVKPSERVRRGTDIEVLRKKIPSREVSIEVKGLENDRPLHYRRFLVDRNHSNSYSLQEKILSAMLGMGSDELKEKIKEETQTRKIDRFSVKEIHENASRINAWEEINLQRVEEKDLSGNRVIRETLHLDPYSVHLILLEQ